MRGHSGQLGLVLGALALTSPLLAQSPRKEPREFVPPPFDRYFERRVAELSSADWQKEITAANWPARQTTMRAQLQRMLGLDPWPARGELGAVITGTVPGDGYVVEKLHFQSLPGVYVTANLYRPTEVKEPLPAVLYVCGHAHVAEKGVSLGNKTAYQHHGIWFARHGYVCLVLDTVQLGEIQGEHHGTHKLGKWWWPARGYTPAGIEAWNGIRALDYLETRSEVDRTRIGMTGRSGGGAYTWWVAALDERIKVAAPTAGITTLKNHVLDGAIEGHCDCMYHVNTERWDFDRVAALLAPRPLLIVNTDKDEIFPLDGVMEIYNRTRGLYRLLGKQAQIGLHIAEGPHADPQQLHIGAFNWMNRFLKGGTRMDAMDEPTRKAHAPAELKVFAELPNDERVTKVDEFLVPTPEVKAEPPTAQEWAKQRDTWMKGLRDECFRAWPAEPSALVVEKSESFTAQRLRLTRADVRTEEPFRSELWLLHRDDVAPKDLELVVLNALADIDWKEFTELAAVAFPKQFPNVSPAPAAFSEAQEMLRGTKWAMAYFCPRGTGPTSYAELSESKRTHLKRRALLLGETLESGQVWDITRAAAAVRRLPGFAKTPLWLQAQEAMAVNTLYASLFIPNVTRIDLHGLPSSHRSAPTYLNVLRHLDLPQTVALAAERATVVLYTAEAEPWSYAQRVGEARNWGKKRLQIRPPLAVQ